MYMYEHVPGNIFNTGHIGSICDNKIFSCTLVCRACFDLSTQARQFVTYKQVQGDNKSVNISVTCKTQEQ